jgi:dTDP-4-dehydrorhamnose 3,5-epimerase
MQRTLNSIGIEPTSLPGVVAVTPRRVADARGFFSETYNQREFEEHGLPAAFVQDNHSLSVQRGTIRGLHFQVSPHPQGKLVRCTRGSILDVVLDLRTGSPTYLRHTTLTLSAENWRQLWIPPGFAHGYCTLEDNCEVVYKVTEFYSPECDRGVAFDDPALGIAWPVPASQATMSQRDRNLPRIADLGDVLFYGQ